MLLRCPYLAHLIGQVRTDGRYICMALIRGAARALNTDNGGRLRVLKGLEVRMVLIQSRSRWFDTRACSAIRATCSAGGYSSGQRGQTVNLLAYAYGGSSPSPPINATCKGLCVVARLRTTLQGERGCVPKCENMQAGAAGCCTAFCTMDAPHSAPLFWKTMLGLSARTFTPAV